MFEPGDLVSWMDPNDGLRGKVCRIKFIHDFGGEIMDDTIVTILDEQDNAYDVYACELEM